MIIVTVGTAMRIALLLALFGGLFLSACPLWAQTFQDCEACPEMVVLPEGQFIMGRAVADRPEEGPAVRGRIDRPFAIARTETTFGQFAQCVAEGGCSAMPFDRRWGMDDRPVIYVNWDEASAYTAWLSAKTGRSYRLPTEEEWEYAARGGRPAPRDVSNIVNCFQCWDGWAHKTEPVGQFPANGFGLYDMLGNVMEWTADCWRDSHDAETQDCALKTRKGGSWYFKPSVATPTYRYGAKAQHKGYDIGFRVVADIE